MAQTKKGDVHEAILAAAFAQFSVRGYGDTTIPAIAAEARISSANVYRYFPSKLAILYTLYEPWLVERLDRLGKTLTTIADPRLRLERLLLALWRDLPRATHGFANNVMQALSSSAQGEPYDPRLRRLFQGRVAGWIAGSLGVPIAEAGVIAGVALMAFDGFAMNARLAGGIRCDAKTARLMAGMLMGGATVGTGSADGR
ncbi:MAG: TetR/AcrR family transcriptional regulator [Caldimonas sp.]